MSDRTKTKQILYSVSLFYGPAPGTHRVSNARGWPEGMLANGIDS